MFGYIHDDQPGWCDLTIDQVVLRKADRDAGTRMGTLVRIEKLGQRE